MRYSEAKDKQRNICMRTCKFALSQTQYLFSVSIIVLYHRYMVIKTHSISIIRYIHVQDLSTDELCQCLCKTS